MHFKCKQKRSVAQLVMLVVKVFGYIQHVHTVITLGIVEVNISITEQWQDMLATMQKEISPQVERKQYLVINEKPQKCMCITNNFDFPRLRRSTKVPVHSAKPEKLLQFWAECWSLLKSSFMLYLHLLYISGCGKHWFAICLFFNNLQMFSLGKRSYCNNTEICKAENPFYIHWYKSVWPCH